MPSASGAVPSSGRACWRSLASRGGAEPDVWVVRAFFPLLGNLYWYLSAFFLLQILIYFVGPGIERLGVERTGRLSVLLVIASSVMGFTNGMGIGNGYTAFWLLALWLLGKSVRLNQEAIECWFSTPRLIIAITVLPLCVTWLEWHDAATGSDPSRWLSYIAPTCIIQSLCLFGLLIRIKVRNLRAQKMLALLSRSAFGVYMIDNSNWFYGIWLSGRFARIMSISVRYGVPSILIISLMMFAGFLLLEALRLQLFGAVRRSVRR